MFSELCKREKETNRVSDAMKNFLFQLKSGTFVGGKLETEELFSFSEVGGKCSWHFNGSLT